MRLNEICANSSDITSKRPQIYAICIMEPEPIVYIGETCQQSGVLARFYQHMSQGGTLKKLLKHNEINNFAKISLIAVDLTEYGIFDGVPNKKRLALEYSVQVKMRLEGGKVSVPFHVISNVKAIQDFLDDQNIDEIAKKIVEKMVESSPFVYE